MRWDHQYEIHVIHMLRRYHSQYIKTTFAGASNSISINGMDSAEMEAELAKAQEGEGMSISVGVCFVHGLTAPKRSNHTTRN